MNKTIISVSGLRGIIGESLDPTIAANYAAAFASTLQPTGPFVLSRDGRNSGNMLAAAISATLSGLGFDVIDAGVAATPTHGVLVRHNSAVGGIQISASHNPAPYNGMKLFGASGRVIDAEAGEKVLKAYHQFATGDRQPTWAKFESIGESQSLAQTVDQHLEKVLATVDVDAIRSKEFKVVLDSNRGAGSVLGRPLLKALGCRFDILGDSPDGGFEHAPEPTSDNLADTALAARDFGADAVFCQDPDADRLAIIDELGNYIGEEYTLAITANQRLAKTPGPVVVNCATSRMTADIADKYGCPFHISAVGEANVTQKMIETDAVYGGEGNGGPIDPQVGLVRDSFVAMAQVLEAMATQGKTVSKLVADLPRYEICKTKIQLEAGQTESLLDSVQGYHQGANVNRMDGLRLDWPDRWLLVRASNTEPIVRAIAEAKTMDLATQLCDSVAKLVDELS